MTPKQKQRALQFTSLVLLISVIVALVLYALSENLNVFYTPTDLVLNDQPLPSHMRLGGMVRVGSFKRQEGLKVQFVLTDFKKDVQVHYEGVLPDLFRESQGVVVLGSYEPTTQIFIAHEVLAKHDENYRPPGVPLDGS